MPKSYYVRPSEWIQCKNCGVIYRVDPNKKLGIYFVNSHGIEREIQPPDPPEHWCGAEWQGPRPRGVPAEWIPGKINQLSYPPTESDS